MFQDENRELTSRLLGSLGGQLSSFGNLASFLPAPAAPLHPLLPNTPLARPPASKASKSEQPRVAKRSSALPSPQGPPKAKLVKPVKKEEPGETPLMKPVELMTPPALVPRMKVMRGGGPGSGKPSSDLVPSARSASHVGLNLKHKKKAKLAAGPSRRLGKSSSVAQFEGNGMVH